MANMWRDSRLKFFRDLHENDWWILGIFFICGIGRRLVQYTYCALWPKRRANRDQDQNWYLSLAQGGRCCASVRAALTERSGSSTKGRTPNIRYFVAKLSNVAIYALFERLSQGFQRKPSCFQWKQSCFRSAFNKSHPAFVELSTKAIQLS